MYIKWSQFDSVSEINTQVLMSALETLHALNSILLGVRL